MTIEAAIPPFTRGAAERVRDVAHLRAILAAYHRPELRWRGAGVHSCREFRRTGEVQLIVADGRIIGLSDVDTSQQPTDRDSPVFGLPDRRPRGQRKMHGGAGTRLPTTLRELVERAKKAGAEVTVGGSNHLRVKLPGGRQTVTIPVTPSDWRSVYNAAKQLHRSGVNVMRF